MGRIMKGKAFLPSFLFRLEEGEQLSLSMTGAFVAWKERLYHVEKRNRQNVVHTSLVSTRLVRETI
ncbi:hypothetical protein DT065_05375 [Salicibibacter kimchii]|uniref:Uncharacterized protein n=1 Tax=Salicibibacter kimchii TaxID=2099786 RepID=A0A345BX29_9BACI|nr:hypothetical protein DT065_05375 [Salicibibacter kimchii]